MVHFPEKKKFPLQKLPKFSQSRPNFQPNFDPPVIIYHSLNLSPTHTSISLLPDYTLPWSTTDSRKKIFWFFAFFSVHGLSAAVLTILGASPIAWPESIKVSRKSVCQRLCWKPSNTKVQETILIFPKRLNFSQKEICVGLDRKQDFPHPRLLTCLVSSLQA